MPAEYQPYIQDTPPDNTPPEEENSGKIKTKPGTESWEVEEGRGGAVLEMGGGNKRVRETIDMSRLPTMEDEKGEGEVETGEVETGEDEDSSKEE